MVISFLTPQMTTWLLGKLKVVNTCKCIHQIFVDELSTRWEFSSNGFNLIQGKMYLSIFKMKTAKEKNAYAKPKCKFKSALFGAIAIH